LTLKVSCSFPITFGLFSGTYFEVCQTERYVQEAEGESSNKLTISFAWSARQACIEATAQLFERAESDVFLVVDFELSI